MTLHRWVFCRRIVSYISMTTFTALDLEITLGECLLISSLPGKASRTLTLAESRGFLEAEHGKLDIKRHEPRILLISIQVGSLFKLAIMT